MHLTSLELRDFRCYGEAAVQLGPGVHVLIGANAQGKTNVLEALHYLAVGASHRVASDLPLVRAGAEAAVVRARARTGGAPGSRREVTVELELRPGGRNRARLNGQPRPRVRDAFGQIRSVLFAPEDLVLVRGDPADRRRFLDELLAQRRPAYLAARQEYDRVLRQRNALLKAGRPQRFSGDRGGENGSRGGQRPGAGQGADPTLATWTDALVSTGATLLAARIAVVHALAAPAAQAYRALLPGGGPLAGDTTRPDRQTGRQDDPARDLMGPVRLAYELSTGRRIDADPRAGVPDPAELAAELRAGLDAVADEERWRGMTLAGPHRDEMFVGLGDLPAKGYASHGEQWSLALALRLASREVLHEVGEEPVVLLDDVFAELDENRRARLAARCAGFEQVIVTAAVDADVPLAGVRHQVGGGRISGPRAQDTRYPADPHVPAAGQQPPAGDTRPDQQASTVR